MSPLTRAQRAELDAVAWKVPSFTKTSSKRAKSSFTDFIKLGGKDKKLRWWVGSGFRHTALGKDYYKHHPSKPSLNSPQSPCEPKAGVGWVPSKRFE